MASYDIGCPICGGARTESGLFPAGARAVQRLGVAHEPRAQVRHPGYPEGCHGASLPEHQPQKSVPPRSRGQSKQKKNWHRVKNNYLKRHFWQLCCVGKPLSPMYEWHLLTPIAPFMRQGKNDISIPLREGCSEIVLSKILANGTHMSEKREKGSLVSSANRSWTIFAAVEGVFLLCYLY